jgi:ATP/maltotriose-dependent transcriptional regulator MalT
MRSRGGDMHHAALLVERAARQTLIRGQTRTLQAWLSALPAWMIRLRARLCVASAWLMEKLPVRLPQFFGFVR